MLGDIGYTHPGRRCGDAAGVKSLKPPFDITADLETPVSAFLKLAPLKPRFLLETVYAGERPARYSYLGFGDCADIRLDANGFSIDGKIVSKPKTQSEVLDAFRSAFEATPQLEPHIPAAAMRGGLIGVAAYDLARRFERLPEKAKAAGDLPDAHYLAPTSVLVFDQVTRSIALITSGGEAARQKLREEIIRLLRGPIPANTRKRSMAPPEPTLTEPQFMQKLATIKEHILAGDVYQCVLSVGFRGACDLDPFDAYRALRLLNPSPYMYYVDLGDSQVVGSSPEALVKLKDGRAEMRPIAGTRRRGKDAAEDDALHAELLADPKENAEHVMLVDLARNDLGRVATAGGIKVEPFRSIERYSHVMHIVSGVAGALAPGKDAFDLFAAAFPAGTLVGAPKVRAMEIIEDLEPVRRGFYGGTVGYFGQAQERGACLTMDQAITIRTLVFHNGGYSYQAGAGIVADSIPAAEYQEVFDKSAILRAALKMAEEGL